MTNSLSIAAQAFASCVVIIFGRWDAASEISEIVYKFQRSPHLAAQELNQMQKMKNIQWLKYIDWKYKGEYLSSTYWKMTKFYPRI